LPRAAVSFSKLLFQNQIHPMKVEAGQAQADCRPSIKGRVGAAIYKGDMDRPGLIDLRRYGGDLAEIRLQVLSFEPMQRGQLFRLETHDELGG
jgi:hypothetical protein